MYTQGWLLTLYLVLELASALVIIVPEIRRWIHPFFLERDCSSDVSHSLASAYVISYNAI